jgi:Holliday junction resolvasome RuvABC endonuclease subunit
MKKIVMLSGDPGTKNFGLSVTEYTDKGRKVLWAGMNKYMVTSLLESDLKQQQAKFAKNILRLIKKYHPTHMAFERFQVRGMRQQSIVECVSVMLGVLCEIARRKDIDITLLTAATWKNHFQKIYKPLPDLYEDGQTYKVPPHIIDSNLIGWYVAQKLGYFSYKLLYKDQTKWLKTFSRFLKDEN